MQHPQPDWPKTLDEFRAWHERQPEVWEFIHGVPKLMAPGSKAHTVIKSNVHEYKGYALSSETYDEPLRLFPIGQPVMRSLLDPLLAVQARPARLS